MIRYLPLKRICCYLVSFNQNHSTSSATNLLHVPWEVHLCESQDYLGPVSAFQLHFSDSIPCSNMKYIENTKHSWRTMKYSDFVRATHKPCALSQDQAGPLEHADLW